MSASPAHTLPTRGELLMSSVGLVGGSGSSTSPVVSP
jgi:hypothetical protein